MKQFETRINLIVNYFLYNLEKTLQKIKKFKLHLIKLNKNSSQISNEPPQKRGKSFQNPPFNNQKQTQIAPISKNLRSHPTTSSQKSAWSAIST